MTYWYLKDYPYTTLLEPDEDARARSCLAPGEPWNPADHGDGECAFIITCGHLRIREDDDEQGPLTVEVLNPGEIIGVLADGMPGALESVAAMDRCEGYWLTRTVLARRAATKKLPPIIVTRKTALRTWRFATHPSDLLFRSIQARLAGALIDSAERFPSPLVRGKRRLVVPLCGYHLADLAGASLEMTHRELKALETLGFIGRAGGKIAIHDASALRQVAADKTPNGRHGSRSTNAPPTPIASEAGDRSRKAV